MECIVCTVAHVPLQQECTFTNFNRKTRADPFSVIKLIIILQITSYQW